MSKSLGLKSGEGGMVEYFPAPVIEQISHSYCCMRPSIVKWVRAMSCRSHYLCSSIKSCGTHFEIIFRRCEAHESWSSDPPPLTRTQYALYAPDRGTSDVFSRPSLKERYRKPVAVPGNTAMLYHLQLIQFLTSSSAPVSNTSRL